MVGLDDLTARGLLPGRALPIGTAAGPISAAAAAELGLTDRCAATQSRFWRHFSPHVLTPSPWGRTQIHHQLARFDETQRFIDFLELVSGARAVALQLGLPDVRVIDVFIDPRPIDLAAFGFFFHFHLRDR